MAALTALVLVLIAPSGAQAAVALPTPEELTAQVEGVVAQVNGTVSQVTGTVSQATGADELPTGVPAPPADPVKDVVERASGAPEAAGQAVSTVDPTAPAPAAATPKVAPRDSASPPTPDRSDRRQAAAAADSQVMPAGPGSVAAAPVNPPPTTPHAADEARMEAPGTGLPFPDAPVIAPGGAAAAAAAGFSAGALAILLSGLFLGASALRTRLPRFGEDWRPSPLVFALERPG